MFLTDWRNNFVKTRIKRVGLAAELIQIIIHGHDANAISIRRLAWQQLAVKMLQAPSNCGIGAVVPNITDGLKLLEHEGIVIQQYMSRNCGHRCITRRTIVIKKI